MKRFASLLCVVDPELHSDDAVRQAIKIADNHQARISFVSFIENSRSLRSIFRSKDEYDKAVSELIKARKHELENWISGFSPNVETVVEIESGIGFIQIIKRVHKYKHDLVIKQADNHNWLDRIFTSEDMHLIRKCPCPVLMLKSGKVDHFRSVLATVDVNDDSVEKDQSRVQAALNQEVLEYSATICAPDAADFHIGSVWEANAENFLRYSTFSNLSVSEVDSYVESGKRRSEEKLASLIENMNNSIGKEAMQYLQPKVHLIKGEASRDIPMMTEEYRIDLIVMGTVGRIGIPGFIIGNTAESILQQVKCSVLAIKPEGFQSLVT